jgi:hypothetical protein
VLRKRVRSLRFVAFGSTVDRLKACFGKLATMAVRIP